MANKLRIGVDLGGTKLLALALDENFRVLASAKSTSKGNEGSEKGLESIRRTITEALTKAGFSDQPVESLGIGCPGVVDLAKGVLKIAPNLGWRDVPVRDFLVKSFQCPVTVLNDVDAGTFGEYRLGAAKGARSVLGVFPGTGLGGGFVYDGRILHGKRYSCMEFGHLRLSGTGLEGKPEDPPTLESLASRLAITSAAAVEAYRGNAPSLVDLPISKLKTKALRQAVDDGSDAIRDIIKKSIHYLGLGVASAVDLLGPDVIVLGGGLVERFSDWYLAGVRKLVERYSSPELLEDLKILPAKLGDDAVALGAAAYAEELRS